MARPHHDDVRAAALSDDLFKAGAYQPIKQWAGKAWGVKGDPWISLDGYRTFLLLCAEAITPPGVVGGHGQTKPPSDADGTGS